tara:strand:- start:712 stop:2388 length:1677 start_codon:yes stop_codon:yes gene_type:complete
MNKTLYEEALADAQKLRELAEETAKNRVIDAIMPQIRGLVDRRILGEQVEDLESLDTELLDFDQEDSEELTSPFEDLASPFLGAEQESAGEIDGNVVNIDAAGDVNIDLRGSAEGDSDEEDDFVLTDTMAEALARLIKGETGYQPSLEEKIDSLSKKIKKLRTIREAVGSKISKPKTRRLELAFAYCVKEALSLRSKIILTEQGTQEKRKLELKMTETLKEMRKMSKSNRNNIFDFLFEADEAEEHGKMKELDEAEVTVSLELDDEEKEELGAAEDAEAVDTALEDILADLELAPAGDEEVADEELADEEMGGEDVDEEGDEEELDLGEGEMYELDEAALRRELSRMRRLREQEEAIDTYADPDDAEEIGDVFYDVNEDDLINVLADELGSVDDSGPADVPAVAAEVRRRRAARMHERRRRAGRRSTARPSRRNVNEARVVAKYKGTVNALKKQLVEMNLFNAKLLYANKLMQNKNLTVKQQRAIVEAIDNAKTLREAKLLYKSLSESLTRRARGKKLNEGALRTLGSSSRSTRSAQPKSSGVEVDRWAVLAGLPGKN